MVSNAMDLLQQYCQLVLLQALAAEKVSDCSSDPAPSTSNSSVNDDSEIPVSFILAFFLCFYLCVFSDASIDSSSFTFAFESDGSVQ